MKLTELLGIKTYEEEYRKVLHEKEILEGSNDFLKENMKKTNTANNILAKDIIKLEDEIELLKADPEQYIEQEIEKRTLDLETKLRDNMDHKWYNIGRMDAYNEMGIKRLDAMERGNHLAIQEDGEIVELIGGLEDVYDEDEIFIDDLVEVQI